MIYVNKIAAICVLSAATSFAHSPSAPKIAKRYPLKKCIISNENLGPKGEYIRFIYRDQEMKVCCESCKKKFKKAPNKYLKILSEQVAKQKKK